MTATVPMRNLARILPLAVCAWCLMAQPGGAAEPAQPAGPGDAAAGQPAPRVLLISDAGPEYDEGRSRLTNLLDGMGLEFDLVPHDQMPAIQWRDYQLVIVAPTAEREFKIDETLERSIVGAIAGGTNVLWLGGGIWGSWRTTALSDAFGLHYVSQGSSTDAKAVQARFTDPSGAPAHLTVYGETLYTVEARKATVEGVYLGADGQPLPLPFITHYRANAQSGQAVYVSLHMLAYWKAAEAEDSYGRAEVLFKYLRRLTSQGTVGKHPVRDGHEAVFLLRLEDYTPGGAAMAHTGRLWLIRMQRLLELTRENHLPVNIALIPLFRHPSNDEFHAWDDADPAIVTLRRLARQAFADGGTLIVHGYAHQHGQGPANFSGDDWEMWDADTKQFLPFEEQKKIAAAAVAEVTRQWQVTPTVWETPHYKGNADTARAVQAAGFRYITESDTKLFPNRSGYLNAAAGLVLNIPETAFNYPAEPDEIKQSGVCRQRFLLAQLARLNGLFYFFYHNSSTPQEKALENLLAVSQRYDLWKPSLAEYAAFWEAREQVKVNSRIDPVHRRLEADVEQAFTGLTLAVRLPDGALPGEVAIGGVAAEVKSREIDGNWYVYPVLPAAPRCRVVIGYRQGTPAAAAP